MRCPKLLILLLLVLAVPFASLSQVKKSPLSGKFRVPKVSGPKAKILCPIFEDSEFPYQGIGVKFGDPFALTYKFYPTKHWSFAADVGKASSGLYSKYYRTIFNAYLPDTLDGAANETVKYLAHRAKSDWFLETKFLYQVEVEKISKGLQLYAGLGWQWRSTDIDYDYLYENGIIESKIGKFNEKRFTYGPVGLLGFEYSYFSLPLSAFIEIEWFTDALLDPGYSRFQGGVGLRYIF